MPIIPQSPLEALARVTRDSMRAEAAVTSLVGKTVRGGSVFGTQNETLAATLETAAGVMVKKLVEHEGFCYFQVTEGKPINAAGELNVTGPALGCDRTRHDSIRPRCLRGEKPHNVATLEPRDRQAISLP